MIRHTAVSTDQRKANILEQVNLMHYNQSETIAAFGIKVADKEFVQVDARQLLPPKIEDKNGSVTPDKGVWRMEFGNQKKEFLKPVVCLKWCILNTDSYVDRSILNSFAREVRV